MKEQTLITRCSGIIGIHLTIKLDSYKQFNTDLKNNIEIIKLNNKSYKLDLSKISGSNIANDLRKFSSV